MTPVNHASVIEDDEQVSKLKERILEMEEEHQRRELEMMGVIRTKEGEIQEMQTEIH